MTRLARSRTRLVKARARSLTTFFHFSIPLSNQQISFYFLCFYGTDHNYPINHNHNFNKELICVPGNRGNHGTIGFFLFCFLSSLWTLGAEMTFLPSDHCDQGTSHQWVWWSHQENKSCSHSLVFFFDSFPPLIYIVRSWDIPPVYLVTMGPWNCIIMLFQVLFFYSELVTGRNLQDSSF